MKKLLTALTIILALTLSGCGENVTHLHVEEEIQDYIKRNNDNYYTQEELDELLNNLIDEVNNDFDDIENYIIDPFEDLIDICDNADTPDDIGGLADTDCDEIVRWYADNWEELYDLLDGVETLKLTISELESIIEEMNNDEDLYNKYVNLYNKNIALSRKFKEYQLLKFEWSDYNATATNYSANYLEIFFYDKLNVNYYKWIINYDFELLTANHVLYYNDVFLFEEEETDIDSTFEEFYEEIKWNVIDDVVNFDYFYSYYRTGN